MIISLPVGFVQSILLARLLPVDVFGVVAGMTSLATLSGAVFEFGLAAAFSIALLKQWMKSMPHESFHFTAVIWFSMGSLPGCYRLIFFKWLEAVNFADIGFNGLVLDLSVFLELCLCAESNIGG